MKNKTPLKLEAPGGERRLLLHACCAPCSSAILELLVAQGFEVTFFYSNSNIFPLEEYVKRRDECIRWCAELGVEFVDDDYDHFDWLSSAANGLEAAPERGPRCLRCFRYRLSRAAHYAHEHGFHVLATTLATSRWKNLDQVNEAGYAACEPFEDVLWWAQNWRKGGLQERRNALIREKGFYNQQWCGCEFSQRAAGADLLDSKLNDGVNVLGNGAEA